MFGSFDEECGPSALAVGAYGTRTSSRLHMLLSRCEARGHHCLPRRSAWKIKDSISRQAYCGSELDAPQYITAASSKRLLLSEAKEMGFFRETDETAGSDAREAR